MNEGLCHCRSIFSGFLIEGGSVGGRAFGAGTAAIAGAGTGVAACNAMLCVGLLWLDAAGAGTRLAGLNTLTAGTALADAPLASVATSDADSTMSADFSTCCI